MCEKQKRHEIDQLQILSEMGSPSSLASLEVTEMHVF